MLSESERGSGSGGFRHARAGTSPDEARTLPEYVETAAFEDMVDVPRYEGPEEEEEE